jgi:hydrogenase maturation protease
MTDGRDDRAVAPSIVVLAMGNALLSDDGAGVKALGALAESAELPPGTRLVDGGTAGPTLLDTLAGCDRLLVLDAVEAGGEPGDVVRLDLRAGLNGGSAGTVHELGLTGLLADLVLLGHFPERAVLLGIQPGTVEVGTSLSPAVERGVRVAVQAALEELRQWAASPGSRSASTTGCCVQARSFQRPAKP